MANVPSINYKYQTRHHVFDIEPLSANRWPVVNEFMHGGDEPNPSTNAHPHTATDSNTVVLPPPPVATTTALTVGLFIDRTPYDHHNVTIHEFIKCVCFLCRRKIEKECAIYMYKDLFYCSERCRTVDMDKDDEKENKHKEAEEEENRKRRNMNKRKHENPFFSDDY